MRATDRDSGRGSFQGANTAVTVLALGCTPARRAPPAPVAGAAGRLWLPTGSVTTKTAPVMRTITPRMVRRSRSFARRDRRGRLSTAGCEAMSGTVAASENSIAASFNDIDVALTKRERG